MAGFQLTTYAFSQATADDFEIVAAVSGKRVAVVNYHLAAAGTNTVKFTDSITDEVQTLTVTGAPTGGTFTVTYSGQTTGNIAYNASAATVQTALEALSNIGAGEAVVTGSAGGPWTVTFAGTLADTNVDAMTTDAALLTGGTTPDVVVATSTAGGSTTNLTGAIPTVAGSQLVASGSVEEPLFRSTASKGLSVTLSAANSVAGFINYAVITE